ncbi:dnaJ homolog subfamily B member 6-like [Zingiber officinale]|uniref:J domain-containing protein n=1 Tax=Zingiber officinale TaxID=94328 RepID=A0A8J5C1P5_ZINOF|nr:dnaJ homolog subfamily B member 6-like [Zingiber officinale]KAG6467057.1 hypothetical protein ZIOFF_075135 [Zingiber officinale]
MSGGDVKIGDFYEVLGLRKECSEAEVRNAYRKLAMKWHPDKCSASGSTQSKEEAKEKFQEIQNAYSVLSDSNKRFLYDVGVYDKEDDNDEYGMGDFLGEIVQMMSQTKPVTSSDDSLEELQKMFVEMFQDDLDPGLCGPWTHSTNARDNSTSRSGMQFANRGYKRCNSSVNSGKANLDGLEFSSTGFCAGLNDVGQSSKGRGGINNSKRRSGRKQKVSSKHDVSTYDADVSVWKF